MRKLVAVVAVAAGLVMGSVASAAPVDIFFNRVVGSLTDWTLTVNNNTAGGIGAVNILVRGLNVMTLNAANTGISPADSGLGIDPLGDGQNSIAINNTAIGVSIVGAGLQNVLLASLSGPGPVSAQGAETDLGSPTVFDTQGVGLPESSYSITVPEPGAMVLLGLGLAALGLVRRAA